MKSVQGLLGGLLGSLIAEAISEIYPVGTHCSLETILSVINRVVADLFQDCLPFGAVVVGFVMKVVVEDVVIAEFIVEVMVAGAVVIVGFIVPGLIVEMVWFVVSLVSI